MWRGCTLGDVITLKRGHDLPGKKRVPGPVPVVSSSGITGRHIEPKADPPGVVTGRYGTIGEVFFIEEPYWPLNTALYVIDFKGNDPRFVAYLLRNTLRNYKTEKAAVPGVNRNVLHTLKVRIPNPEEQSGIVSILAAYDDLIENNRRRIALLEEEARLLYREWFVHLRFPGHQDVKITDGLPEGWESRKLGDLLAKIKRPGKVKKGDYLQEGSIPCVDQSESFIGGYTNNEDAQITTPLPLIVFGDHTRVVKFIDFPFACGADGTQLLFPKDARLSIQYFYYAVSNVDLSNYFYARHLKFLKDQNLLLPTANLISEFTDFSKDTLKQVSVLREVSHYLARARDLLLPRLMNGEIAV